MIVREISKRCYEKLFLSMNKRSLILRSSYQNRGYRYWSISDKNLIHGFVVMQKNVIIAIETWPKRRGFGSKLIRHLQNTNFKNQRMIVHYSSDEALSFYQKIGIHVVNTFE